MAPVAQITAATTSITAFIGAANAGDANAPTHCFSFADYERQFGGSMDATHLGLAVQQFFANGGSDAVVVRARECETHAADGIVDAMRVLVSEGEVNLLCLPGFADPVALAAADAYCRSHHVFLIADPPETADTAEKMLALVSGSDVVKSDHAAMYFPWMSIADPSKPGQARRVPPSGALAGIYARTDQAGGVWRAPAGSDARLLDGLTPDRILTTEEAASLNRRAVNCIRQFPAHGTIAWGARTLAGDDDLTSDWKYIPVRRTGLFIEKSISRGLTWVLSQPNGEPLWMQIRQTVGTFMHQLFRQGAFLATSPHDAYFVQCGSETTTQADVNAGIVNIVVGFAPLKPAEFVIIKLQQLAARIPP
jgi:uncharacterized protein